VAPQGLVGRCVLWKSGLADWQHVQTETVNTVRRRTIGSSKGPRLFREETFVFLPTDIGYLALVLIHVEGLCRRRERPGLTGMSKLAGGQFGKPELWYRHTQVSITPDSL